MGSCNLKGANEMKITNRTRQSLLAAFCLTLLTATGCEDNLRTSPKPPETFNKPLPTPLPDTPLAELMRQSREEREIRLQSIKSASFNPTAACSSKTLKAFESDESGIKKVLFLIDTDSAKTDGEFSPFVKARLISVNEETVSSSVGTLDISGVSLGMKTISPWLIEAKGKLSGEPGNEALTFEVEANASLQTKENFANREFQLKEISDERIISYLCSRNETFGKFANFLHDPDNFGTSDFKLSYVTLQSDKVRFNDGNTELGGYVSIKLYENGTFEMSATGAPVNREENSSSLNRLATEVKGHFKVDGNDLFLGDVKFSRRGKGIQANVPLVFTDTIRSQGVDHSRVFETQNKKPIFFQP